MAYPDTQIFWGFFSTASPEWLRTCPEGMFGDSRHLADPPELPCYTCMILLHTHHIHIVSRSR